MVQACKQVYWVLVCRRVWLVVVVCIGVFVAEACTEASVVLAYIGVSVALEGVHK